MRFPNGTWIRILVWEWIPSKLLMMIHHIFLNNFIQERILYLLYIDCKHIFSDLLCKDRNASFTRLPLWPLSYKKCERWQMIDLRSVNFCEFLHHFVKAKAKHICRETTNKKKLNKLSNAFLIYIWSGKGTARNRKLSSLHGL